ncbi:hypothetical protein Hte_003133 [Hypoxylon texense]
MTPDKPCSKAIAKAKLESLLIEQPVDIILQIADNLGNASVLCLALTCKPLFVLLYSKARARLEPPEKETLLCCLEKDIPGVFYCHFCKKLMQFDQNGRPAASSPGLVLTRPSFSEWKKCVYPHTVSFARTTLALPYHHARLITNYGLFGSGHGFPPSYLSTESLELKRGHGYSGEVWRAKLIGDELFLSCIHTRFDQNADADGLQKFIKEEPFFICQHVSVGAPSWNRWLDLNLPPVNAKEVGDPDYHKFGSCGHCLTDWDASIEWSGAKYGWMVKITTYHNLGGCRSPFDQKWQAMAEPHYLRFQRDLVRGAVKGSWVSEQRFLPDRRRSEWLNYTGLSVSMQSSRPFFVFSPYR